MRILVLSVLPVLEKVHEFPHPHKWAVLFHRGGTGTHLSGGRGPSFTVTARAKGRGKGGVGSSLVKVNDAPTLEPKGLPMSKQQHIPIYSGVTYACLTSVKSSNPCVGLSSNCLLFSRGLVERTTHRVF